MAAQLAVEEPMDLSVHVLDGVKEPALLLEKVTVPIIGAGVGEVSVTVAVHWVGWLTATEGGLQLMLVEVVLGDVDAKNTPLLQVPLGTPLPLFPPIQYTNPESNAQLCV